MDEDWGLHFSNNTNYDMYFYLHYYKKKNVTYPNYDVLIGKPYLHLIQAHDEGGWSMWPTKFGNGKKGHVYAFSPDTLERYSWDEIIEQKKYWFGEIIICNWKIPIQFPEEFEYMGDEENDSVE